MRISLVILSAVVSAVMLLTVACSADEADPNATATPAPPATIPEGDRAPEPTAAPTAVPATAAPAPAGGTSGTVKLAIDVSLNDGGCRLRGRGDIQQFFQRQLP